MTQMGRIKKIFGLCPSLIAHLACQAVHPAVATTKVIGGAEAADGQFPAAVTLGNCTATKIAEGRLLTAAHCVIDKGTGGLRSTFRSGAELALRHGVKVSEARAYRVTIVATEVHPLYAKRSRAVAGPNVPASAFDDLPDLALISFTGDTSAITPASVLTEPVAARQKVLLAGYGCEDDPLSTGDGSGATALRGEASVGFLSTSRLKFGRTEIDAVGPAHYIFRDRVDALGDVTLRLCAGDSGGGVYLDTGKEPFLMVLGVNSYVAPGESAATRLDDAFHTSSCLAAAMQRQPTASQEELPVLCSEFSN